MLRRLLALIVSVGLVLSLGGCVAPPPAPPTTGPTARPSATPAASVGQSFGPGRNAAIDNLATTIIEWDGIPNATWEAVLFPPDRAREVVTSAVTQLSEDGWRHDERYSRESSGWESARFVQGGDSVTMVFIAPHAALDGNAGLIVISPLDESAQAPQPTSAPTVVGGTLVDTGFRPATHGFSFENYGGNIRVTNLTPEDVRRMFGDQVVAQQSADGRFTLTPAARQWMQQSNNDMRGGHCEGMAVLSQLLYAGIVDPAPFGGSLASQMRLQGNEALQREIAYWFATQTTTWDDQRVASAAEQIQFLQQAYTRNPKDLYRVGIIADNGQGGHAITAYAVRDRGNGIYWIMVYDNNMPREERYIEVDTRRNTWEYEGSPNPEVQSFTYRGSPNNPLYLAANEPRLGMQPCEFCQQRSGGDLWDLIFGAQGKTPPEPTRYNQVWAEGDAQLLLQDTDGNRLGFVNGELVNEIPGAFIMPVRSGETNPVFWLPVGVEFDVIMDGDSVGRLGDTSTEVVMIGPGYYLGIEGIVLDPGQKDQLTLDGRGDAIAYRTSDTESPRLVLGVERPGADFELALQGLNVEPGAEILATFDVENGAMAVSSTADRPGSYTVAISRIGDEGVETFETNEGQPVTLEVDDILYFYFGRWEGQGKDLDVGWDRGGDGTIDEIITVADNE